MARKPVLSIMCAALFCSAALSVHALDIEGSVQLGNVGFAAARAATDGTYTGADYFAGGYLSLHHDMPGGIRIEAALQRDLITGNTFGALLQYRSEYFRVGLGPSIGIVESSPNILRPGIAALLGVEYPGV